MLVYNKNPFGILKVGKYRIYGRALGYDPVDLPWTIYKSFPRLFFDDASYTAEWMSKRFNCSISPIAFQYNELNFLPYKSIMRLAKELGVFYRSRSNKELLCREIRYLLKHGVKYSA